MLATAALLAALAAQDPPAGAPGAAWAGTWKCADPEVYATIVIAGVGPSGFSLEWDENVGINGTRVEGSAKWLPDGRAALVTDRCELTLAHTKDDRLLATMPEGSCFAWSSHAQLEFVRENVTVHEKASFDCRKAATPVERAICANRDLAEADRQLSSAYKTTTARAGDARERLASAQRAWIARRDRDCGKLTEPDSCLLRAYGRRLLELRAWPEAPFGPSDRPDVAVLTRVLVTKGEDAIARTGLAQLAAGLVGGIPARDGPRAAGRARRHRVQRVRRAGSVAADGTRRDAAAAGRTTSPSCRTARPGRHGPTPTASRSRPRRRRARSCRRASRSSGRIRGRPTKTHRRSRSAGFPTKLRPFPQDCRHTAP